MTALAQAYARLGWHVFPLVPLGVEYMTKDGMQVSDGKPPAIPGGFRNASANPVQVASQFSKAAAQYGRQPGIGFWPGQSNILVLDVDIKDGKGGATSLQAMQDEYGELPQTLTQYTPSGGWHLFFSLPEGVKIGQGWRKKEQGRGIDVRSSSGYVCVQGTVTAAGEYAFNDWEPSEGEAPDMAMAPAWLIDLLTPPGDSTNSASKKPASASNHDQATTPPTEAHKRHAALIGAILSGETYHDALRDLAASYIGQGMPEGTAVVQLRALMQSSAAARDDRWQARYKQIPELVRTAGTKFTRQTQSGAAYDFDLLGQAAQSDGEWNTGLLDAADQINAAMDADTPPPPKRTHPLAQFLDFDLTPKAPSWVLDGAIEEGVVVIAGMRGIGKTTTIAPLSLVAAGLHAPGDPLAPKAWRHVIYLTEHASQVFRVVAGLVRFGGLGITEADVAERFHVVNTVRMEPEAVVGVASEYMARFARIDRGVTVKPLVVFDTWAASFALESENDNSETSRAIACLKQRFQGMPAWVVAHMAKAAAGRADVVNLSARGAGALEADTIQNVYLVHEGEGEDAKRILSLKGKKRFDPKHGDEFEVESHQTEVAALDAWGDVETTVLRWNTLKPLESDRHALKAAAREDDAREAQNQLRSAILSRLDTSRMTGEPLSRTSLKAEIKGFKNERITGVIEILINEGWIYEVDIPAQLRVNVNKRAFLVGLKDDERRMLQAGMALPPAVTAIPPGWKKPEIPSGPLEKPESTENAEITSEMIAVEKPFPSGPKSVVPLKGENNGDGRGWTETIPRPFRPSRADGDERGRTGTDGDDTTELIADAYPVPADDDVMEF